MGPSPRARWPAAGAGKGAEEVPGGAVWGGGWGWERGGSWRRDRWEARDESDLLSRSASSVKEKLVNAHRYGGGRVMLQWRFAAGKTGAFYKKRLQYLV